MLILNICEFALKDCTIKMEIFSEDLFMRGSNDDNILYKFYSKSILCKMEI